MRFLNGSEKRLQSKAWGLSCAACSFSLQGWFLFQVFPPPLSAEENYGFSLPEGAPIHQRPNLHRSIKHGWMHFGHPIRFRFLPDWSWLSPLTLYGIRTSPVWRPETQGSGGGQRRKTGVRHQGQRNIQVQIRGWYWQDAQNQNPK